jgi:hypothetical protein
MVYIIATMVYSIATMVYIIAITIAITVVVYIIAVICTLPHLRERLRVCLGGQGAAVLRRGQLARQPVRPHPHRLRLALSRLPGLHARGQLRHGLSKTASD